MLCGVGGTSYAPLKTPLPIFRGNVAILNLHCSEAGHTGCAGSRGKRATFYATSWNNRARAAFQHSRLPRSTSGWEKKIKPSSGWIKPSINETWT